jgi:hypothetical protein
MTIPEFTAQASLYRTSNSYRSSSSSEHGDLWSGHGIVPAYFPGPAAKAACNNCLESALTDYFKCIATQGFPFSLIHCSLGAWWDAGSCIVDDCCPRRCGPPDVFDLAGSGCCDANEHCVDRSDPNSRSGCCPSDQTVCAGKCCAKGYSCCGDTCCPPNYFCLGGGFCSEFPGPLLPPRGAQTPTPPPNNCIFGGAPCGPKCCPPGLECCSYSVQFGAECKTSCLH